MIGPMIRRLRRESMTAKSRRRLRRRLYAALLLLIGLVVAGGLAATLTPKPQVAQADEQSLALLRTGKQLYETSCVTCHGANLQGVPDRGPSLIGTGEAAVYFQVGTGRMPAMRGEAQAPRKDPMFDPHQVDAIGAYVQANGGGPVVPRDANGDVAQDSLVGSDVARGGDLFRLNCSSCHNFTGRGGALSSGRKSASSPRRSNAIRSRLALSLSCGTVRYRSTSAAMSWVSACESRNVTCCQCRSMKK